MPVNRRDMLSPRPRLPVPIINRILRMTKFQQTKEEIAAKLSKRTVHTFLLSNRMIAKEILLSPSHDRCRECIIIACHWSHWRGPTDSLRYTMCRTWNWKNVGRGFIYRLWEWLTYTTKHILSVGNGTYRSSTWRAIDAIRGLEAVYCGARICYGFDTVVCADSSILYFWRDRVTGTPMPI